MNLNGHGLIDHAATVNTTLKGPYIRMKMIHFLQLEVDILIKLCNRICCLICLKKNLNLKYSFIGNGSICGALIIIPNGRKWRKGHRSKVKDIM